MRRYVFSCVFALLSCGLVANVQAASLSDLLGLDEALEEASLGGLDLGGIVSAAQQDGGRVRLSASPASVSRPAGSCCAPQYSCCGGAIGGGGGGSYGGGTTINISINIDIDVYVIGSFNQPVVSASGCL